MPNEKNMPDAVEALGTVEDIKRAIEAILFAAGYPVKYEKLSEVIGLSQRDIRGLVESMAREYDGRGIQILLYPDTCQLTTKEVFAPYIREALGIKRGGNLSASSLEVLAVVAYNQPVTRAYIDTVRGVDSSYAVTSLLDKNLIESMSREYDGRGIQLLLYPDTCQLTTKEVFAPYIREALGIKRGGNLSASSLEVLAVVAYNQPVTRAYIDTVRGVDSSYAVTSLLDKNLIEAVGRLDAPGRPMLYGTTDKFLRVFGLSSLADLPETEALGVASAQAEGVIIEEDKSQLTIDTAETSSEGKEES